MEPLVDTLIEDARWHAFGLGGVAERVASECLVELGLAPDGFSISVLGCNDARIAELNGEFRGKQEPTNVLSWPTEERGVEDDGDQPLLPEPGEADMPEELGDIAIAWETCAREAEELDRSVRDHVTHLIVHGVLHLLGYDHMREQDAALMEATEIRILAKMGIANPYG